MFRAPSKKRKSTKKGTDNVKKTKTSPPRAVSRGKAKRPKTTTTTPVPDPGKNKDKRAADNDSAEDSEPAKKARVDTASKTTGPPKRDLDVMSTASEKTIIINTSKGKGAANRDEDLESVCSEGPGDDSSQSDDDNDIIFMGVVTESIKKKRDMSKILDVSRNRLPAEPAKGKVPAASTAYHLAAAYSDILPSPSITYKAGGANRYAVRLLLDAFRKIDFREEQDLYACVDTGYYAIPTKTGSIFCIAMLYKAVKDKTKRRILTVELGSVANNENTKTNIAFVLERIKFILRTILKVETIDQLPSELPSNVDGIKIPDMYFEGRDLTAKNIPSTWATVTEKATTLKMVECVTTIADTFSKETDAMSPYMTTFNIMTRSSLVPLLLHVDDGDRFFSILTTLILVAPPSEIVGFVLYGSHKDADFESRAAENIQSFKEHTYMDTDKEGNEVQKASNRAITLHALSVHICAMVANGSPNQAVLYTCMALVKTLIDCLDKNTTLIQALMEGMKWKAESDASEQVCQKVAAIMSDITKPIWSSPQERAQLIAALKRGNRSELRAIFEASTKKNADISTRVIDTEIADLKKEIDRLNATAESTADETREKIKALEESIVRIQDDHETHIALMKEDSGNVFADIASSAMADYMQTHPKDPTDLDKNITLKKAVEALREDQYPKSDMKDVTAIVIKAAEEVIKERKIRNDQLAKTIAEAQIRRKSTRTTAGKGPERLVEA